jgi:phosphoserine phosphatase
MENKLKPETTPVINELREANIRCVMITGMFDLLWNTVNPLPFTFEKILQG